MSTAARTCGELLSVLLWMGTNTMLPTFLRDFLLIPGLTIAMLALP